MKKRDFLFISVDQLKWIETKNLSCELSFNIPKFNAGHQICISISLIQTHNPMKTPARLLTLCWFVISMIFSSCESDLLTSDYIEFTVDGKSYEKSIKSFLNPGVASDYCLLGDGKELLDFESTDFDLNIGIVHYVFTNDFSTFRKPVTKKMYSFGSSADACHLDLIVKFRDKLNTTGPETTLSTGSTTIESVTISDSDEEEDYTKYRIKGTFSGIFTNQSGENSQISGRFDVVVKAEGYF